MYKIIIDSCGELTDSLKKDGHFCNVALELDVDGYRIRDDESFDQHDFLRRVKESVKGPKSSCPSPEEYMQAFEGEADHVYVVTLSGKLSGSYNSAVLAVNLYNEEHEDGGKQIYVFNSCSASIGDSQIFSCLLPMATTDINTTRFHLDPVHLHQTGILIRQTGPYPVLSQKLLCGYQIIRRYKRIVHSRRIYKSLKLNSQTASDFTKHSDRWIRCALFYLSKHAFTHTGLFRYLI